jgi:hypothetical protein
MGTSEASIRHRVSISDGKSPMAPPVRADRIVFQSGLYCFARNDIIRHESEGEVEQAENRPCSEE